MRRLTSLLVLLMVAVLGWNCGRDELGPVGSDPTQTGTGGINPSGGSPVTGGSGGTGGSRTGGAPVTGGSTPVTGGRTGGTQTGGGGIPTGGRTGGVGTGGVPTGGRTGGVGTGGAPTGGVPTGGVGPTGGFGGVNDVPGLVACGTQSCVAAKDQCCVAGQNGAVSSTCLPLGAMCPGISLGCAKPSDCGGGNVCCAGISLGGDTVGIGSSCTPAVQCRLTGVTVCRVDADCSNARRCCALPAGPGICRPNC